MRFITPTYTPHVFGSRKKQQGSAFLFLFRKAAREQAGRVFKSAAMIPRRLSRVLFTFGLDVKSKGLSTFFHTGGNTAAFLGRRSLRNQLFFVTLISLGGIGCIYVLCWATLMNTRPPGVQSVRHNIVRQRRSEDFTFHLIPLFGKTGIPSNVSSRRQGKGKGKARET